MEDFVDSYDNPFIRSLIKLVPHGIGSAVDVLVMDVINKIRHERLRVFFDELGRGNIELTEATILSEDFLHCYFNTLKAVLNSRRREKVNLLARLLKNSINSSIINNTDDYEFFLKILDDLSLTEIEVLCLLHDYEIKHPIEMNSSPLRMQENSKFWNAYLDEVSTRFIHWE